MYLCVLFFIFIGIGIISDIFMEAIEVITSQTQIKEIKDSSGAVVGTIEEIVWNPTVANLSLMALGSSAPEIMLSVIETITQIDDTPGELGPSTIVGSAAFNLLIITAVSIMAVDEKPKKIDDINVFAITAIFSVLAYLWMFAVLKVWSPNEVELYEAIITLSLTIFLILFAYVADTCRQRSRKQSGIANDSDEEEGETEDDILVQKMAKSALRRLAISKGESFVLEIVTSNKLTDPEMLELREEVVENFKKTLKVDTLDGVDMGMLLTALQAENPLERIAFRKANSSIAQTRNRDMSKVMVNQVDNFKEDDKEGVSRNPKIGFNCLHYMVSESCGTLEIKITKKVQEDLVCVVRTVDGTACHPSKYKMMEELVNLSKTQNEHTIRVEIVDDPEYHEDLEFYVEICTEQG